MSCAYRLQARPLNDESDFRIEVTGQKDGNTASLYNKKNGFINDKISVEGCRSITIKVFDKDGNGFGDVMIYDAYLQ